MSDEDLLERLAERLVDDLRSRGTILVAYSGGVDSGLVAALAHRAVGEDAVAVTAAAETLAGRELDQARQLAREIGIRHEIVTYSELSEPEFVRNPSHRCYVCQGMRMGAMQELARRRGIAEVCDGTNASDAESHDRPGLRAVRENGIYSPLLAHDVDKETTRALARHLQLSVWDRPANACLSSRIPHGELVTLGRLQRIEAAEEILHEHGFRVVRVRSTGDRARVEVGGPEIERLEHLWGQIEPRIEAVGFRCAELDRDGYRSGGAQRG